MKKALLIIALTLAGASAAAGQGYLKHCGGEIYTGPVRSVRVERAQYIKVDGQLVEGPRRLVNVVVYSDDRRRAEHTAYDEAGEVRNVYVRACYEDGKQSEYAMFDGGRRLRWRKQYSRDGGEILDFDADGRVTRREVVSRDASGRKLVGSSIYNGEGVLVLRTENTLEDGKSVWATYDGEGRLRAKAVHTLNYGGPHHAESYTYRPDGTVGRHTISKADAAVRHLEKEGLGGRESERREYDAHRNLVKLINYRHDPLTGEMAPVAVFYHEITYF
jgi:YD repeat-containing protein